MVGAATYTGKLTNLISPTVLQPIYKPTLKWIYITNLSIPYTASASSLQMIGDSLTTNQGKRIETLLEVEQLYRK